MEKIKVLFAGESWFFKTIETKGFDEFVIGGYETEIDRVKEYMKEFADITHIPAHMVLEHFPDTLEELKRYDVILVSDVGANTFMLHPKTFFKSQCTPNKFKVIADYVAEGGAFGMIGGYMTFMGFEGKGKYHGSLIEEILPVTMLTYDDREEHPEGIEIIVQPESHSVLQGVPAKWPALLGYNKLIAKQEAEVVAEYNGDPILALGHYGSGKTFAWASDCAPHWMPAEFCNSKCNKQIWENVLNWAITK